MSNTIKYLKLTTLIQRVLEDLEASTEYKVVRALDNINLTFFFEGNEYIEYSFNKKFFEKYLTPFIYEK